MNKYITPIIKANRPSGHYPDSDPSGDNVKYINLSAWYGVIMVFFIMFSVSSLSAQKLINLDDYLAKMKDEPVTTSFRPSTDSEMDFRIIKNDYIAAYFLSGEMQFGEC